MSLETAVVMKLCLPEQIQTLDLRWRAFGIVLTSSYLVQASRAQILKKAADYIQAMRRKNSSHQQDIDDLKKQNRALEDQIKILEKAKNTGNYTAAAPILESHMNCSKASVLSVFDPDSESDVSSDTDNSKDSRRKKLKTSLV
ncbi:protein max [Caerostris extrusa]|uniref:Protein max n=1 Tax=Caerostris extrusa TaxID=172846 RepID=A0AAV4TMC3_CAEEX|nr:protein max [Caerostris extrusa]